MRKLYYKPNDCRHISCCVCCEFCGLAVGLGRRRVWWKHLAEGCRAWYCNLFDIHLTALTMNAIKKRKPRCSHVVHHALPVIFICVIFIYTPQRLGWKAIINNNNVSRSIYKFPIVLCKRPSSVKPVTILCASMRIGIIVITQLN